MAGLKELRNRLNSVKSTEKITTAMKLVAASRLRKATTSLEKNSDYTNLLENTVARILLSYRKEEKEKKIRHILPPLFIGKQNPQNYVLIVFSSERGLCGNYNQTVAKTAVKRLNELKKQGKNIKIVCYGKKAYDILKKNHRELIVHHEASFASGGIFYSEAIEMIDKIIKLTKDGGFDVCEIIHSHFKSAANRKTGAWQLYPLQTQDFESDENLDHVADAYFDYKPSREEILDIAAQKLLINRLFSQWIMLHKTQKK